jgi:hypothetical protein
MAFKSGGHVAPVQRSEKTERQIIIQALKSLPLDLSDIDVFIDTTDTPESERAVLRITAFMGKGSN